MHCSLYNALVGPWFLSSLNVCVLCFHMPENLLWSLDVRKRACCNSKRRRTWMCIMASWVCWHRQSSLGITVYKFKVPVHFVVVAFYSLNK